MRAANSASWWDRAAWALLAPVFLYPIGNPDLYWHLAAAKRIVVQGAIPRDDSFSYTLVGRPWVDFEWLAQLIFGGVDAAGGFAGLLGLKILLTVMAGALIWSLLGAAQTPPPARRLLMLFWGALTLPRSDLRPEIFSVLLFTALLHWLEMLRRGELRTSRRVWLGGGLLFGAAWANLHPAFPAGFALAACYLPFLKKSARADLTAGAAAAAAGTLCNPAGTGIYHVLAEHARYAELIRRHILEWRPLLAANPYHWPALLLLAAMPAAAGAAAWHGKRPAGPHLCAAAFFGAAAALSARQAAYAAPVGLLLLGACATDFRPALSLRLRAAAAAAVVAAGAYFAHWAVPDILRYGIRSTRYVPEKAADFIARELPMLRRRRVYNEWGWGGYLAWRFNPDIPVFMDGRYIFHPLLAEVVAAFDEPAHWQAFLKNRSVDWAVLSNTPMPISVAVDIGGERRTTLDLPHFALYMPVGRWALVHADPFALVFVRRHAFPEKWVAAREYDRRELARRPIRR